MCQCKYKLYEYKYSMNVDTIYLYSITARLWILVEKKIPSYGQFPGTLFLFTGIVIAFHVCWNHHCFSFFFFIIACIFELFTLSKNSFDHPNARQWNYFHLEKKMLYMSFLLISHLPIRKT